jgi:tRNA(Leu) C34 or U34 (ribose-2'-O)-methylase TrmL
MLLDVGAPVSPDGLSCFASSPVARSRPEASIPRGFAAIGLHNPKDKHNIGGVIRAASCYGAACVAISGERIRSDEIKAPANTTAGQRHLPVLRGDLRGLIPYASIPVAVDLIDDAEPLPTFIHPESAFYIFGPEDGTLGREILAWCPRRVMVPTRLCMNLAATVNVVLYDRLAKQMRRQSA